MPAGYRNPAISPPKVPPTAKFSSKWPVANRNPHSAADSQPEETNS